MPVLGHERMMKYEGLNQLSRCANYLCSENTSKLVYYRLTFAHLGLLSTHSSASLRAKSPLPVFLYINDRFERMVAFRSFSFEAVKLSASV